MKTKDIENLLEAKGVKPTSNRVLVFRELKSATGPVSLADLEIRLDTMDKASIFRVLELFSQMDVVHQIVDGSRSMKYELCFGDSHHSIFDQHVHFHCESCKETFCLEDTAIPIVQLPDGFVPRSANYVIKGVCPKCARLRDNKPCVDDIVITV